MELAGKILGFQYLHPETLQEQSFHLIVQRKTSCGLRLCFRYGLRDGFVLPVYRRGGGDVQPPQFLRDDDEAVSCAR